MESAKLSIRKSCKANDLTIANLLEPGPANHQ